MHGSRYFRLTHCLSIWRQILWARCCRWQGVHPLHLQIRCAPMGCDPANLNVTHKDWLAESYKPWDCDPANYMLLEQE